MSWKDGTKDKKGVEDNVFVVPIYRNSYLFDIWF